MDEFNRKCSFEKSIVVSREIEEGKNVQLVRSFIRY